MLYQRHFVKGTIVFIVAFLDAKMTRNGTISLDAQKTRTALQQNSSRKRL